MNASFAIKIKTQYEIEYLDDEMLVNVTIDDLREPVPMVMLSKFFDTEEFSIILRPSKEIQLVLYTRIADFLKQQGYCKIYTEEFGEI